MGISGTLSESFEARRRRLFEEFEPLLQSYIRYDPTLNDFQMIDKIFGQIFLLVEKNARQEHPDDVIVALAAATTYITTHVMVLSLMGVPPDRILFLQIRNWAVNRAARWLVRERGGPWLLRFWRPHMRRAQARHLLESLLYHYLDL